MNDTNILDILDIKPPLSLETDDGSNTMLWVLLFLLLIGTTLFFWVLRKPVQAPTGPTPNEIAERKLREVWALLGTPVLFIKATADILRMYMEERFSAHAPDRTTEEFLVELQKMPQMTRKQKDLLLQFLKFCDFPKFAQLDPSEEECRQLHAVAVKIVNETAPALPGSLPPKIEPPVINS